jgi:hypothetical protein
LKDHGDAVAENVFQLGLREREQVARAPAVVKESPAGRDVTGRLDQPHDGECRDALAAARLAHDAEHTALVHRERDAVDGPDHSLFQLELCAEVCDLKQRLSH